VTSPAFVRFVFSADDASYDRAAAALLELPTPGWQEADEGATLVFWLAADIVDDPSLQEALAGLQKLGRLRAMPERADWLTYWKRFHHSVRVGAVTVRPPWLPADPDALDVVIDVGLAFGTGSHATTRQCLAALQEVSPGSLLDIGTGSGVTLSLASQDCDGFIIENITRVINQTILTVAGVGIKRDVGHDTQLREILFQRSHHAWHKTIRIVSLTRIQCFSRCVDHRKNRHHRHTQLHALLGIEQ